MPMLTCAERLAPLLVCLCLASGAWAPPAQAQFDEDERPAPPPAGCLGSNDPWCDTSGGGDSGDPDPRCHVCEYIPPGPDGEASYYTCAIDDGCCDAELSNCVDGWDYCDYDGYCVYT